MRMSDETNGKTIFAGGKDFPFCLDSFFKTADSSSDFGGAAIA